MSNTRTVFDVTRQVEIKLRSADGTKTITVRFPTDEEWIERQRRRKIIIKQLGRGVSETVIPGSEEADAELVAKLRVGDGPEVDAFEASRILEQLSQADVDDVIPEAGAFRVLVRVPGGITAHVLRMPSAKDIIEYRRAFARILDLPFNKQELTVNLAAAGSLYQKLCKDTQGYAGAIPIVHQAVAVKAAMDALEAGLEEDQPANF
ncbi:MAG TPA: hypothetical protein VNN17_06910 [Terriglobia bacterium]|nr:hypothetical protein [Terriglobia bacterium]